MKTIETLVIGAGQAGLAAAWHLKKNQVNFLILEATNQIGGSWHHYYDSLKLFSPAAYSSLPDFSFPKTAHVYPLRDEVINYLKSYAEKFNFPIQLNESVISVIPNDQGFEVLTSQNNRYQTKTIIAASGAFAKPYIPKIKGLDKFKGKIIHSASYLNPQNYINQKIVVVGAANSAVQIAAELGASSNVTIASREKIKFFPQKILGMDFHWWLKWTGLEKTRWLNDQSTPVLDDGRYRAALKGGLFQQREMFTEADESGVIWANGAKEEIDTLLFATGFRPNVSYLDGLKVIDSNQNLIQRNGVSDAHSGLYFLGFPKQRNFASATLRGVGADAAYIMPLLLKDLKS